MNRHSRHDRSLRLAALLCAAALLILPLAVSGAPRVLAVFGDIHAA